MTPTANSISDNTSGMLSSQHGCTGVVKHVMDCSGLFMGRWRLERTDYSALRAKDEEAKLLYDLFDSVDIEYERRPSLVALA